MSTTLIVILVIVVVLGLIFAGLYNGLVKLRNVVQESWAQIDVELKRRHDLIGNLVETVKGYAAHERGTLDEVTGSRRGHGAQPGPRAGRAVRGRAVPGPGQPPGGLRGLPGPQGQPELHGPSDELSSTEDRIASARRYYNANVRALNTKVETLPTNVIAGMAGVTKAEYFETEGIAREAPQVSFGTNGPATPAAPSGPSGPSVGQAPAGGGQLPPGPQDSPPPQG